MFSLIEKIKYVASTKFNIKSKQKAVRKNEKTHHPLIRIIRRILKWIAILFVAFIILGLLIYYNTSPTIHVEDSNNRVIQTDQSPYLIRGYLNSGIKNSLKINDQSIKMVDNEFVYKVDLEKGDNTFIFEASNKKGVNQEIYIIRYIERTSDRVN